MTTPARDSHVLALDAPARPADSARERAFKRAMDGLYMVFQPIVSWTEREIVAYEALVRTCEPELARPDLLFSGGRAPRHDHPGGSPDPARRRAARKHGARTRFVVRQRPRWRA